MKLVLLIGDTSVGKMTVGQELMKITDLRLFHNHMTIEMVLEVFGYYDSKTISRLREVIFEEYAKTKNYGLIFTYMWAFNMKEDWEYIEHLQGIFKDAEIYCVELVAPLDIRLQRNRTENRLMHKPSKRDIVASDQRVIESDVKYRCVSDENEIPYENYLRIDNSSISAKECAELIKKHFDL